MRKSVRIGLISVFAALHAVLYFLSFGLWRNWAVYLEPLEGIILGPWLGFSTALIGSIVGRMIKPVDFWMFGIIAEPIGVLASGFLARGRWKPVAVIYVVMLTAYFLSPLGRWLPLWPILDIFLALVLIYPVARLSKNLFEKAGRLPVSVGVSFIGTVTDALTRVFLLIPVGLYTIFYKNEIMVYSDFVAQGAYSFIEDIQVIVVSLLVGVPVLLAVRRILGLGYSPT